MREIIPRGPLRLIHLLTLVAISGILLSWVMPAFRAMRGPELMVAWLAFAASSAVVFALAHRRFALVQVLGMIAASVATTALPLLILRGGMTHLLPKYVATLGLLIGLWVLGPRRRRIEKA